LHNLMPFHSRDILEQLNPLITFGIGMGIEDHEESDQ
jgi:hypothetical protein